MNASRGTFLHNALMVPFLVLLLSIFYPALALADTSGNSSQTQPQESPAPEQPKEYESAMVVIDGNYLLRVAGVKSYPAEKRAEQIVSNIIQLAEDSDFDPESLKVKEDMGIFIIYVDDLEVVGVLAEDAQLEGDFTTEVLANQLIKPQIAKAIENYRYERRSGTLKKNVVNALIRTVLLVLILISLFWVFKKIDRQIEVRFKRKIDKLESKSQNILQSQQIWSVFKLINRFLKAAVVLIVIYIFLNFVLGLFPWTRQLADTLLGFVINPLKILWQSFVAYLPSLFFLIILYFVFRYILKITRAFFSRIDLGRLKISGFEAEWAWPTYRIIRVFVIILGVVLAYPYIPGSGSEAFKGISILFGILFSLGSSSLISNIIAGYTMTYRRAFNVGDRVKFGEHEGVVTDVRLLESTIRSLKNEEIVIPNAKILNGEVTNYSSMAGKQGVILHTTVGIGYEVPWRQVEAMLLMAAHRTSGLHRKSEPFVLQKALGDFGVTYELNVFCRDADQMPKIYSDLHRNIQDVFNEYEVAIMTPHYVGDTEDPKMVPREKWYASPAQETPE